MLLTLHELLDIIIMTAVMGYLFKDVFTAPRTQDPLASLLTKRKKEDFLFAASIIGPSIILHELAHKFVAIGFGMQATFHAFYANSTTLILGIIAFIAKLTGFGFVFLVPGFVSISGVGTPLQNAIVAFSGPAIHGLFYVAARVYQKQKKSMSAKEASYVAFMRHINGFLFVLNMLPIPGIDGFHVYLSLIKVITG